MFAFCWISIPVVLCYTIDSDCFDKIFDENNSRTDRFFPDDTLVTVTHLHKDLTSTTIRSVKKMILTKGIPTTISYRNPSSGIGFKDYNPRNLTLHFDGKNVVAAIGHLIDSYNGLSGNPPSQQEWLPCQNGSFLTFHEYVFLSSAGIVQPFFNMQPSDFASS